jgi:uncharacterized protein YebE (UPF0316 family)
MNPINQYILTVFFSMLLVFGVGVLECFLSSLRYKFLQRNKKVLCFSTSFIYNIIYIYILAMVLKNLNIFYIVIAYSIGYGLGDVLAITFDNYLVVLAKLNGKKWNRRLKKGSRGKK